MRLHRVIKAGPVSRHLQQEIEVADEYVDVTQTFILREFSFQIDFYRRSLPFVPLSSFLFFVLRARAVTEKTCVYRHEIHLSRTPVVVSVPVSSSRVMPLAKSPSAGFCRARLIVGNF